MAGLNIPLRPYYQRACPVGRIGRKRTPEEIELESQPVPMNESSSSEIPLITNTGMFRPTEADITSPVRERGVFGQDAEYREPKSVELPLAPTRDDLISNTASSQPSPIPLDRLREAIQNAPANEVATSALSEIPLARVNVNQDKIDAGLESTDPRAFRAAQAMRTNYDESKPRGILGKIGHHFVGAGKGVLEGLARGKDLGEALGGAAMGAALGGASPRLATNLANERELALRMPENIDLENRRTHQAQVAATIENQRLQREAQRQAQESLDLQRDAQRRQREADAADRRLREDQTNKEQREKADFDRQKAAASQKADLSKASGEFVTPSELLFKKRINAGNTIPVVDKSGFYVMPSAQQQQDRKLELEKAKGEADLNLAIKKEDILAPRKLDFHEATKKIDAKYAPAKESPEDKEEKNRVKRARDTFKRISAIRERAAKQDEESKGMSDAEKRDAKRASAQGDWDTVRRELAIAADEFPDLIEGTGLGDGEYPFPKFHEPKGKAATGSAASASNSITRAQYDKLVEKHGKTRTDAYVAAGHPVQ